MNRIKKIFISILTIILLVSNTNADYAHADILPGTSSATMTVEGWLTDLDGNLITDTDGYYVFYISEDMIIDGTVEANFNKFAALFLRDFYNVSSAVSRHKLRIVNVSGVNLAYVDYDFTTENVLPRTDNIFAPVSGSITNGLNRGLGSAYAAMQSTITSDTYRTDLCIDTKGFDGKNINIMIVNLRAVNSAMMSFYGVDRPFDISLPQFMNFDTNLRNAGYSSYAEYLKAFYGVSNLSDLTLNQKYDVLGTANGTQTGVTYWKDNTVEGKAIPASELGSLTNEFKIWGLLGLNKDSTDAAQFPYVPNYHMMETDSEVLEFAYEYLYENGLRFSFDQLYYEFDSTDQYYGVGGDYGIKAYVEKTPGSTANVDEIFAGLVLRNGDSIELDDVTAGLYVPNAWNQYRLYDFGFTLYFEEYGSGIIPATSDFTNILLWGTIFLSSVAIAIYLILGLLRKRRKQEDE